MNTNEQELTAEGTKLLLKDEVFELVDCVPALCQLQTRQLEWERIVL
jgi:hypothetical protein